MHLPLGENATALTQSVCASNGPETTSPVCASQTHIVLSLEPETMYFPSGENATEVTALVCPSNGSNTLSPVFASQTRIVLSYEPEMMCLPSGENAIDRTAPICPSSTFRITDQPIGLSVWNASVPVKNGRKCCAILDPAGANGKADM
jgi:hypothetical protein